MENSEKSPGGNFKLRYLKQLAVILLAGWVVLIHYVFISGAIETKYRFFRMQKLLQKYKD